MIMLWLCSPTGERLHMLDNIVSLHYRREVNGTGYRTRWGETEFPLVLVVPFEQRLLHLVQRDSRLEVWRSPIAHAPMVLDTETIWLVRRVSRKMLDDGMRVLEIRAEPAIALLHRHIVAYRAGTAQAKKLDMPADDIMKAVVRENFGSLAGSERDISTYLTIDTDKSAGTIVSKSFAWQNVLSVLQELAETSSEAGIPLFFDVVVSASGQLTFKTFTHVRGTNRAAGNTHGIGAVIVSPETGTLLDVERATDWHDEATYVYAAGQGAQASRQIVEVGDDARSNSVPFGRIEALRDARHVSSSTALTSEAHALLWQRRPEDIFAGRVVSNGIVQYGRDWQFGDRVSAAIDGEVIACRIVAIEVALVQGQTHITAELVADQRKSNPSTRDSIVVETEFPHQQVQFQGVPIGECVQVPTGANLVVHGEYGIYGDVWVEGELRVYD